MRKAARVGGFVIWSIIRKSVAPFSVNTVAEALKMGKVGGVKITVFGVAVQGYPFQGAALEQWGEGTDGIFSIHGADD